MLDTARVWVKICGSMRITAEEHPNPSVTPIAKALIKHAPDSLVWGFGSAASAHVGKDDAQ